MTVCPFLPASLVSDIRPVVPGTPGSKHEHFAQHAASSKVCPRDLEQMQRAVARVKRIDRTKKGDVVDDDDGDDDCCCLMSPDGRCGSTSSPLFSSLSAKWKEDEGKWRRGGASCVLFSKMTSERMSIAQRKKTRATEHKPCARCCVCTSTISCLQRMKRLALFVFIVHFFFCC